MSGDVLLLHSQNRTTIGDEMFHIPVRDGKGWFHLSMTAGQTNGKTIKFLPKNDEQRGMAGKLRGVLCQTGEKTRTTMESSRTDN